MANDLTGGFDVVAEFAIPAANRVIAAMHRGERFLHAMSVRVDGTRRPDHRGDLPTLVASVDSLGEPSVDHDRIPTRPPLAGIGTSGGDDFLTQDTELRETRTEAMATHVVESLALVAFSATPAPDRAFGPVNFQY